jgi:hypothetical protein
MVALEPRIGKERDEAERIPAGFARDEHHRVGKQCGIAAKLVDDEAADQRGVGGIDHRFGAHKACDHAAPVDVADQHHRHAGGACETHVGDVIRAQVDLRGAAGAFDQHEVCFP